MRFRPWLKKPPETTPPAQDEHTPGDSGSIHPQPSDDGVHGGDAPVPAPPVSSLEWVIARDALYTDMFGTQFFIDHELEPLVPHIDVYSFPPGYNGRRWWTIVSGGMSDLAMTVPAEIQGPVRHREVILYTAVNDPAFVRLVRFFACYPHRKRTWLGWGHTVTNGDPPTPLFENSRLLAALFLEPPLLPDKMLGASFEGSDGPISFLWMVPISAGELDFKLRYGTQALLDLFDRARHPFVLDPQRLTYA